MGSNEPQPQDVVESEETPEPEDDAADDVDSDSLAAYVSALSEAEKKKLHELLAAEMSGEEKPMSMKDIERG